MKRIGSQKYALILLFSAFCYVTGFAQSVQVSASLSETNIYAGEQVNLQITITGKGIGTVQQPELPPIDGLRWLRGSTSRGQKYSLINGKPSTTYTYGYALIAQKPGSYTVPSIAVEVEGETYQTGTLGFNVIDPGTVNSDDAERSPDIYVRLEPQAKNPVVGQQVVVDVILYFKNGIEVSSYQPKPGWKAEGFWKEELEYPQRAQTSSTIINGVRYQRARLIQYALFPSKAGELTISPFEITVTVRKRRSSSDPFGFGFGQERMNIESTPVKVDVQNLPAIENANFIGAVGDFEITRSISETDALVGETIEVTTEISGVGNVPLVNKPEFEYPEELEKYNPQESSSINRRNRRISGTRTFADILIARNAGTFTIPEARIAYYNPNRNKYETVRLPELSFEAQRDPDAKVTAQTDLRLNVTPITGLAQWVPNSQKPLYQKAWVWMCIVLPLLLTGAAFGLKKYDERMHTDTAFARSRTAASTADETLEKATQSEDVKKGYHLLEKALTQYITDKLNLPPAGLSHHQIIEKVKEEAGAEISSKLKELLSKCATIAYAPNATQKTLDADIQKTKALIKELGKLG